MSRRVLFSLHSEFRRLRNSAPRPQVRYWLRGHAGVPPWSRLGAMSGLSVYRPSLLTNTVDGLMFFFCSLINNAYKISLFDIVNSFNPRQPSATHDPGGRIGTVASFFVPASWRPRDAPPSHPITTECPPNAHPMPTRCRPNADRCPPLPTLGFQGGKGFICYQGLVGFGRVSGGFRAGFGRVSSGFCLRSAP